MKNVKRLPEGELEIMQIIWRSEPPVSRAAIEKEMEKSRHLAATTILTFLTRLCDKGFLAIEKQGRANYYTPKVTEREYLAAESRKILDKLYGGSISTFAAALCDSGISKEELEQLRDMLEEGGL